MSSNDMALESVPTVSKHPCVTCQRRKVKCDRRDPCTRCLNCKQPEAHRAPRRPQKREANVLNRVRQLEISLKRMQALVADGKRAQDQKTKNAKGVHNSTDETRILEDSVGRLIIDDEKTRYISGSSWANLADQVGDLRALLEDDEYSVEDDLSPKRSFTHYLSNGIFPPHGVAWNASYSQIGLRFLWQTYVRNIDPTMKALHVPTTQLVIDDVLSGSVQISKSTYCLLAAIKFAAVTSLTDEQCWAALNSSRKPLLDLFGSEVQAALDAANFLSKHGIVTLQAYAIYQFCNRRHEHPHATWVATGIAIRIAQSIGLHRDGALMRLPVFATEVRRRLFWELRLIDLGSAEDCGFLPTHIYGADTRLPLNINDIDITPEALIPPAEREGFTDMTYTLVRYQLCNRLHRLYHHEGKSSMGPLQGDRKEIPELAQALADCRSIIRSKHLQYCSESIPFQKVTLWLLPLNPDIEGSQRRALETSCGILEMTDEIIHDPKTSAWTWMLQTYMHWHPVAFLLNELCATTQHPQSSRAWSAIEKAYANPHGLSPEANQALWRPLQGLLERAKTMTQRTFPGSYFRSVSSEPEVPADRFAQWEASARQPSNPPISTPDPSVAPPGDMVTAFDLPTPIAT